jgi:calcineurin-like phosphoesterase
MDELLSGEQPALRVLDWHAEATSEKLAMGWYLDGRVTAVVGSHTHVPTADARVLPKGTALVCDTGMVGPRDSILGMRTDVIVDRFRTGLPRRFEVADGPAVFGSVLIDADNATGRARSIERVDRSHPA